MLTGSFIFVVCRRNEYDYPSFSQADHNAGILAWPNPAQDVLHVQVREGTSSITITSALGIVCEFAIVPGTEVIDIPLREFSSGVYVVATPGYSGRLLHVIH